MRQLPSMSSVTEAGRALVVRNGKARPRKVTLGAGTVAVTAPPGGSSPDLCVKAEEAPRLRLGCLGDLLFLEE